MGPTEIVVENYIQAENWVRRKYHEWLCALSSLKGTEVEKAEASR